MLHLYCTQCGSSLSLCFLLHNNTVTNITLFALSYTDNEVLQIPSYRMWHKMLKLKVNVCNKNSVSIKKLSPWILLAVRPPLSFPLLPMTLEVGGLLSRLMMRHSTSLWDGWMLHAHIVVLCIGLRYEVSFCQSLPCAFCMSIQHWH